MSIYNPDFLIEKIQKSKTLDEFEKCIIIRRLKMAYDLHKFDETKSALYIRLRDKYRVIEMEPNYEPRARNIAFKNSR